LLVCPAQAGSAQEMSPFVQSNVIHTLFHEIGHAIIDQFQLPVIGQEEDAVDAFATIEVITFFEEDAKPILIDVAASWLAMDADTDREQLNFYDIHDLDAQRAYRVICHLYGNDPDSWEVLLADITLEEGAVGTPITVSYAPTSYGDLRDALKESALLDDMAHYAQINFDWPDQTLTVTLCYEILEDWAEIERSLE